MPEERVQNELVLPLGQYAHILDETKGNVQTYSGPIKQSLSPQDKPVVFDPASRKFIHQPRQQDAVRNNTEVRKGDYVILANPHKENKQPEPGKSEVPQHDGLRYGEVVNIPGPWSHPLWPQQVATVIRGHQMRSNQYLLARVYDDEAARKNWKATVVKSGDSDSSQIDQILGVNPESLVIGQILVVQGTKVGFYIPPSGIEVLKEGDAFVQDAVTLERLQYSILMGEDGEKVYRQGPDVVFPTPTQSFYTKDGKRKFNAVELQPTSGIHVKVVKDYEEDEQFHKVGDELFITGKNVPIYFPREEHAAITYGGNEKTHAIAIPKGDSRYVLDRESGDVALAVGPQMLLPDPRKQVLTLRALTEAECRLWYPGNAEALAVNKKRAGYSPADTGSFLSFDSAEQSSLTRGMMPAASMSTRSAFTRESAGDSAFADSMTRGTTYTPPRTVTIDGKYDGAPKIVIWPGHAVQVVDSKGVRRTEVGPKPVLLQWDEVLQPMSLSKGKPKNSDTLMRTAFLRYDSNPVSDVLTLVTSDLVNVQVRLKYLVRFEEKDRDRWFSLDNYVQYLCDHLRSLIANAVRRMDIQRFDREAATLIRDVVLGERPATGSRPLRHFEENGMTVYEVEIVAPIEVLDSNVEELLSSSRYTMMNDSVAAELLEAKSLFAEAQQKYNRNIATDEAATAKLMDEYAVAATERRRKVIEGAAFAETAAAVVKVTVEHKIADKRRDIDTIVLETKRAADEQHELLEDAAHHRNIHLVQAEADATEQRMKAVQPGLIEALSATALVGVVEKVAPAIASLAFVNGRDTESVLATLFKGTAAETLLDNVKDIHHGVVARRVNGAPDHA